MNDLVKDWNRIFPLKFLSCLRHFIGWLVSAFRSPEDLVFENLAQLFRCARAAVAPATFLLSVWLPEAAAAKTDASGVDETV
jgi:hypothetical protein